MIFKLLIGSLIVGALLIHGKHGAGKGHSKKRAKTKLPLVPFIAFLTFDILLIIYLFTARLDAFHLPFPEWARWFGVLLLLAGDYVLFLAHSALGRNWSLTPEIKENHELIVVGIYKRIRHPMYSSYLLLGVGFLLASANGLIGALFLIPIAVICLLRINVEDRMMAEKFGEAYKEYAKHTGTLFPKFYKNY